MARVNIKEAQEISKRGDFEFTFLGLKNGQSKRVRFLHNSIDSIPSFTVHSVSITDGQNTSYKSVDCLRALNEPVQKCPLCAIGNKPKARIFLFLVDENNHDLIVWERSAQFLDEMQGYFERYGDLRDYVFDIERRGEKLDTKYTLYPIGPSPIADKSVLPELPEIYGKLILDKTADEQQQFINTGVFPQRINPDLKQAGNQQQPQQNQSQSYPRREVYTPSNPQGISQQYDNGNAMPFGNNFAQNNQQQQNQQNQQQPNTQGQPGRRGWN